MDNRSVCATCALINNCKEYCIKFREWSSQFSIEEWFHLLDQAYDEKNMCLTCESPINKNDDRKIIDCKTCGFKFII